MQSQWPRRKDSNDSQSDVQPETASSREDAFPTAQQPAPVTSESSEAADTLAAISSPDPLDPSPTPERVDTERSYEWNPESRFATAKEALAIKTPLPDGSQIVGYPALPDPAMELQLFQVKRGGDPFEQASLARLIPPGEIAIIVGGYYPELRPKEIPHKRNIGHACLAVGVEREIETLVQGQPIRVKESGVMTINNPQNYLKGCFDGFGYGCFFVQKLKFPEGITPSEETAYKQNIVTMTALANTFIPFAQNNFNGADPLGIHNLEKVQEAGEKLILAVYGDREAIAWLEEGRNTAYCAELVSAGINTGTASVLTPDFIQQLRQKLVATHGEDRYPDLYEVVSQRINSGEFLQNNANPNLKYVRLGMVEEGVNLQPLNLRFPTADKSGTGLAFMYYEFTDIAYGSIRDTYPRRDLAGLEGAERQVAIEYNTKVAQVQVEAFKQAAVKFKQLAKLDPPTTAAFDAYVDNEVLPALNRPYSSKAERDTAMEKLVERGRVFTPTGPHGEGMFIPPDLYLMPTTGWAEVYNAGIAFFPEHLRERQEG